MTDAKPATDRRIERARVALSKEHYTERLWHSDFVKALIARIDTERTVRLAAEARVKVLEEARAPVIARPLDEWHEDFGTALWWFFPICEPPYVGSPIGDDWPGYHTHWTPIECPSPPAPTE